MGANFMEKNGASDRPAVAKEEREADEAERVAFFAELQKSSPLIPPTEGLEEGARPRT
jgi:hypothetical protein